MLVAGYWILIEKTEQSDTSNCQYSVVNIQLPLVRVRYSGVEYWSTGVLEWWPPAPLPACRVSRPEGRDPADRRGYCS